MDERLDMDEEERLSALMKASGDATRRRVLTLLVREGPMRVTDLAAHFEISLNSVSKHIKVLEAAGLVTRHTQWREHVIAAELAPLKEIERWFSALSWVWETRLERLDELVAEEQAADQDTDPKPDQGEGP